MNIIPIMPARRASITWPSEGLTRVPYTLFQDEDGSSRIDGVYVDAAGDCSAAKAASNFLRYKRVTNAPV